MQKETNQYHFITRINRKETAKGPTKVFESSSHPLDQRQIREIHKKKKKKKNTKANLAKKYNIKDLHNRVGYYQYC